MLKPVFLRAIKRLEIMKLEQKLRRKSKELAKIPYEFQQTKQNKGEAAGNFLSAVAIVREKEAQLISEEFDLTCKLYEARYEQPFPHHAMPPR